MSVLRDVYQLPHWSSYLLLWLFHSSSQHDSLQTEVRLCSKPSKGFPFHPDSKPVFILWPARCHRAVPCPLSPACLCRLPLALCTAAVTLASLLLLEHSRLRPLFLLGAHSFILLILLRCHLPSEAFLDHVFKIVISHVCTPCPTFCIIFFSLPISLTL